MQNILSVQSLTKKFDDFTAVKDISFNVKTGSIFAFLGPNGAGKSTTIKMLTTVLKPTTGEALTVLMHSKNRTGLVHLSESSFRITVLTKN